MYRRLNDPAYLKGFWPLNNHVNDISGYGKNGSNTAVTFTAGDFGRSVASFNGTTSTVSFTAIPQITETAVYSVSLWFNASSLPSSGVIFFNRNNTADRSTINVSSTGSVVCCGHWDGTTYNQKSGSIVANRTYHVVFVHNGTANNSLYLNGVLQSGNNIAGTGGGDNSMSFGQGGTSTYFPGTIWNVRVYLSTALTGAEALALYNLEQSIQKPLRIDQPLATLPDITDSTLIGSFLNKATRGTANDYSNSYISLAPPAGETILYDSTGAYFKGTGDNKLKANYTIDKSKSFTLAAWVKLTGGAGAARAIICGSSTAYEIKAETTNLWVARFVEGGGTAIQATGTTASTLNQWFYIVGVLDRNADKVLIYVNGVLDGSTNWNGTGLATSIAITTVALGGHPDTAGTQLLTGYIRDARIYYEAKSAAFIANEYAKGVPDSTLAFHTVGGSKDLSRFQTAITNISTTIGDRMVFNGTSSYLKTSAFIPAVTISSPWTLSFWMNPADITTQQVIFDTNVTASNITAAILVSSSINFGIWNGSTYFSRARITPVINQWQHVVVVNDGLQTSSSLTIYQNGVLSTLSPNTNPTSAGTGITTFGARRAGDNFYNGQMSDIKIWSEAKNAAYILNYYNQTRNAY